MFFKKSAKTKTAAKELPGGCLALFGMPFLLAGLFMSWMYLSGLADWWAARTWVETPCRIVAAELKVNTGSESNSYQAQGRYVYQWEGREYESVRISLRQGGDNLGDFQQRVLGEMKRAMTDSNGAMSCYINPRDPEQAVLVRELRPVQQMFFGIFGLVFPLAGAGLVFGGFVMISGKRKRSGLMQAHPDEPWKWNPAWNVSPVPETGFPVGKIAGAVSLWWAILSLPLLLACIVDGAFERGEGWWAMIPAGLTLIPLLISSRRARSLWRVGHTALDVAIPLRPGRETTGAWITSKPLLPRDTPVLMILCEKSTTTRTGNETNTHSETVWEKEVSLAVLDQSRDISGFRLPFRFRLPADVPESTTDVESARFRWKLAFRIPGTPVKSVFELPVFRDANDPPPDEMAETDMGMAADAESHLPELLDKAKLNATFDSAGNLVSLVCGPRRWLGSIIFLFLFNLFWTGMAVFLWFSDAPVIFKIVWPGSAFLIWLVMIYQILGRRELRLENGEMHVSFCFAFYRSQRIVPTASILSITHGTNSSLNNTPLYWVKLETSDGKRITLASGIAGEQPALGLKRHLERWREPHRGA